MSRDNYYKLLKLQEDKQMGVNIDARKSGVQPRKVTQDEIFFDLFYGKW